MTGLKQNAALGNDITSSHRSGVPRSVRESIPGQLKQESRRWHGGRGDLTPAQWYIPGSEKFILQSAGLRKSEANLESATAVGRCQRCLRDPLADPTHGL